VVEGLESADVESPFSHCCILCFGVGYGCI